MGTRRPVFTLMAAAALLPPAAVAAAEPAPRTSGAINIQITNLDVATATAGIPVVTFDGDLWAVALSEEAESTTDLNADGDATDIVPFLYNAATNTFTNLGTKGPGALNGIPFLDAQGFVGFWVDEADVGPGGTDLNADLDTGDDAMAFYEVATDTTTIVPFASGQMVPMVGQWGVDMDESEVLGGGWDLNGDGDMSDTVPYLYDPATSAFTNLGIKGGGQLNSGGFSFLFVSLLYGGASDFVTFASREGDMGPGVDANGDGDALDDSPYLYDPVTDTMTNLGLLGGGLAGPVLQFGDLVVVLALEAESGSTDLNGDGDANDTNTYLYAPATAAFTNLGVELGGVTTAFAVSFGDKVLVPASEPDTGLLGTDLNGDGDDDDTVTYLYDPATGTAVNLDNELELTGSMAPVDDLLVIAAEEDGLGPTGTDYNGDGDTDDRVLHVYDSATGRVTNLGLAGQGGFLALPAPPGAPYIQLSVSESDQGVDYNGDGDTDDEVLHFYDPATGVISNTHLAAGWATMNGNKGMVEVSESDQGGTDINGDGDADDHVLHLLEITSSTPSLDDVGLVDASVGRWFLRDAATGAVTSFFYGNPGDAPFAGDWDCDGIATPGLYRQSDGFAYLRNSNSQGFADIRFFFGNPGDIPLAGDFNDDGCDTLSLYRPSTQEFFIINKLGENEGGLGAAEVSFVFGNPGDKPVVGDWDGDGVDEIGLHREASGFFYWRNTLDTGIASGEIFFGDPNDRFVAGDWGIIDGVDTPAIFRPSGNTFYFRHTLTQGVADSQFPFGESGWIPVGGQFGL